MRDRVGYVWCIQRALKKGYPDMYGPWEPDGSKKGYWARTGNSLGFSADSHPAGPDFHPFSATFSDFQPRTPVKGWNWGKLSPEMDSAPSKQGGTILSAPKTHFDCPKAPLPGPALGTDPRRARARVLTRGSTPDPYRLARQGGFRVNKSPSQGLTTWYPYFEGAESISGLGLPQCQPFREVLG